MKPEYFAIPKPCSADWNKMTPTEQGAFCTQCNKEVIDLYPVPSDQIKKTIAAKNNPCIRILQSQIDEMNFTEWFRSLNLVKQLRYLFLFTLLLVFQQKSHAQESDTTFIPYSNEYLDELALKTEEKETAILEEQIDSNATAISPPFGIPIWEGLELPIGVNDGWMGTYPGTPIDPWDGLELYEFAIVGGGMYFEMPLETPILNQIILDQNVYKFKIIENQLHFNYQSFKHQKVRIKITKENGEVVYFTPIELGLGENAIIYSLEKFELGHYTITLETDSESQSTDIIYL
ncbi:MAG: hypothetical protein GQ574_26835 [Crocinitomix sp.]|nr:hypothetical protein [Crocinitomix sp.]